MKMSKRVVVCFLITIILINILIRYPRTLHEVGVDSFQMHSYANTIMQLGQIPWINHPMSYFGLYLNSYPAGGPVLLAAFSDISGLNMELTIFIISGFLGLFSCLGAFMLAGAIVPDNRYKLLVAFMYSTSPLLLKFSMWTFSTRIAFLTLLPLLLWTVFTKWNRIIDDKNTYFIVGVLFLLGMATTHRLFWMGIFFVIIFIIMKSFFMGKMLSVVYYFSKKTRVIIIRFFIVVSMCLLVLIMGIVLVPGLKSTILIEKIVSLNPLIFLVIMSSSLIGLLLLFAVRRDRKMRLLCGIGMLTTLLSISIIQFTLLNPYYSKYYINVIAPGFIDISTTHGEIIAMSVVLGARYGFVLIPAVFGLVCLLATNRIDAKLFCVVAALLLFIPFINVAMYFLESIYILFSLVAGVFLLLFLHDYWNIFSERRKLIIKIKKYGNIIVVLFLVCTLLFSIYTTEYRFSNVDEETGQGNVLTEDTFNAGVYVNAYNLNVTLGKNANRVNAISGHINSIAYSEIVWSEQSSVPGLTDFYGWFDYLKRPYGNAEIYVPAPPLPIYAGYPPTIKSLNDPGYVLFINSDTYLAMFNGYT